MSADICLILEGTYPYVRGGVSAWTHELITRQDHLKFHLISLLPRDDRPEQKYPLPSNVVGLTTIHLQQLPEGSTLSEANAARLADRLRAPLLNITTGSATLGDYSALLDAMGAHRATLGAEALLNSEAMWKLLTEMYEQGFAESSMLDYFWSWRALLGGLYSLLVPKLPEAKLYHALSTGYGGMLAARAKLERNAPVLLTEHGIYTNERRIEIALADWLSETASKTLTIDRTRSNLRDFWMDTFTNYSRITYEAADSIVTLFEGNQQAQLADGADAQKMRIIPNGVEVERYASITPRDHDRPTVAMIGRVVPIKDVKSLLRSVAMLRDMLPDVRCFIMGPTDEDADYVAECQAMVEYLALSNHVTFTGQVKIEEYLPEIDVVAFSSISEAQPLGILEVGACGIPVVATDVGACREMVLGRENEAPALGAGGVIVPLSDPQALAQAMLKLLTDRTFYRSCSQAARTRVATYYDKNDQMQAYRELYAGLME